MPDPEGHITDTDAIVALSPDEARFIATQLRLAAYDWSTVTEGPHAGKQAELDALADRIEGAIPVGAS